MLGSVAWAAPFKSTRSYHLYSHIPLNNQQVASAVAVTSFLKSHDGAHNVPTGKDMIGSCALATGTETRTAPQDVNPGQVKLVQGLGAHGREPDHPGHAGESR
jgi:hypothetical protein